MAQAAAAFNEAAPDTWTTEEALKACFAQYEKRDDGSFYVRGNLHMQNRNLTRLPDLTGVDIQGTFFCQGNKLTSLKGSPRSVGDAFWCNNNDLENLAGATPAIGGAFWCHENPRLVSLLGAPVTPEHFYCVKTSLETLEDAPRDCPVIASDFGEFKGDAGAWAEVPSHLKVSEATIERNTVLQSPVRASQPIRLRLKS